MTSGGSPLSDWLARIETLSPRAIDMGLERVERVLSRLQLVLPPTVFQLAAEESISGIIVSVGVSAGASQRETPSSGLVAVA